MGYIGLVGVVGACWLNLVNGYRGAYLRTDEKMAIIAPVGVDGPQSLREWLEGAGCEHVRDTIEFGDRWQYFQCK